MGLYRIQIKPQAAEEIPAAMISLGLPVIRIESRDNGTYYFYKEPKRQREAAFWTHSDGEQEFWSCGLSRSANLIAKGLSAAGLFEDQGTPSMHR